MLAVQHLQRHRVKCLHPEWRRILPGIAVWDGEVLCLGARGDEAVLCGTSTCYSGATAQCPSLQPATVVTVQDFDKPPSTEWQVTRVRPADILRTAQYSAVLQLTVHLFCIARGDLNKDQTCS